MRKLRNMGESYFRQIDVEIEALLGQWEGWPKINKEEAIPALLGLVVNALVQSGQIEGRDLVLALGLEGYCEVLEEGEEEEKE